MAGWLITGGCGFLGSNLADRLLREGQRVSLLDNFHRYGSHENLDWLRSTHGDAVRCLNRDVRDANGVQKCFVETSPDYVAHLAAQVAMTSSLEDPRTDFEVNVIGTINVLEASRNTNRPPAVFFSSSNKVYGSLASLKLIEKETRFVLTDYPAGLDESLPIHGNTPYGCSKLAADQYVRDYARMYDLQTVVFRHSTIYGGHQFATQDQGWVGWFCRKALETDGRNAPTLSHCGNGKQVRDILHVSDAVEAYILAAANIDRCSGEIFNLGGGPQNSLSLLELFSTLERVTGSRLLTHGNPWRKDDQRVFIADTRKALSRFGWTPRVNTEAGLAEMLEWTRRLAT